MKMIFLTGGHGRIVTISSDDIGHIDDGKVVGQCVLYKKYTPLSLSLQGNPKEVGLEINKQLEELKL